MMETLEQFMYKAVEGYPFNSYFLFFFALLSSISQILFVLVDLLFIRIFNPSDFNFTKNLKNNIGLILFVGGYVWLWFFISLTPIPFPGIATFVLVLMGAMIIDSIKELIDKELEQRSL